jgi:hypothetical protein
LTVAPGTWPSHVEGPLVFPPRLKHSGSSPEAISLQSIWATVTAWILTRTSSSFGTGRLTSSSRRTSGGPYLLWTTALLGSLPLFGSLETMDRAAVIARRPARHGSAGLPPAGLVKPATALRHHARDPRALVHPWHQPRMNRTLRQNDGAPGDGPDRLWAVTVWWRSERPPWAPPCDRRRVRCSTE